MSQEGRAEWEALVQRLTREAHGVTSGKMMSAPALTFGGKVFAFYSTKGGRIGLGCRLGRTFDFEALSLTDWQHLAPFKSRPPMKDWIVAGMGDVNRWPDLADIALELARQTQKKTL